MPTMLPPGPIETEPPRATPAKVWTTLALVILAVIVFVRVVKPGAAPIPPMFDAAVTLEQAQERARADHKLVFAFATASWCGPCQAFKHDALRDSRVEDWAKRNAETVYIDIDQQQPLAETLGVNGIPEVIIFKDGRIAARSVGALPADEFLAWLKQQAP